MITNVCPRCHSEEVDVEARPGFYGCKDCGKTGKGYELVLKIQIEGDSEIHYIRNVMREMAGTLSEYVAPHMALGLSHVLERWKASVTPSIAREVISRVVSESFHTMYQMAVPFLPPEIQEDVQRLNDLAMREQAAAQRKENDERSEREERAPEVDGPGGSAGGAGP